MSRELSVDEHVRGVLGGDRAVLGRTITLVESSRPDHRAKASAVLAALHGHGDALRVGLSGPPGVGKSTFLEGLGMRLVEAGRRVAVLAIDPSSVLVGGSLLGDKTRMGRLANDPRAFVRPSPAKGALGGVAPRTGDALRVVEAAGYDVVLVETVGVGQSEVDVAGLVDTFLLLVLAGAGDELQGIKKGILELADVIAVNKADGEGWLAAERARKELDVALQIVAPGRDGWRRPVLACSGLTGEGVDAVWAAVEGHAAAMRASGRFDARRREQRVAALWRAAEAEVVARWRAGVGDATALVDAVADGRLGLGDAVAQLLDSSARGGRPR